MEKSHRKIIYAHIVVIGVTILYFILPLCCPVERFFHIPCPTCGMTGSILAMLHGDFKLSLSHNFLTIPFIFLLLFAVHKEKFKIKEKTKNIIIICGAVLIFVIYLFKNFV